MEKILLIGGPGRISASTIKDLCEMNYEVGVFTLPESAREGWQKKVRFYLGNRNNSRDIENAVKDFKPDAVIDFVCFEPRQAEQLANTLEGNVEQYIFISTCDVYGYPLLKLPMGENDPWNEPNCIRAANKRKCEEIYKSKHAEGKLPLTIVRPSYSMEKRFILSFFSRDGGKYLVPRIRSGLPVFVPGDGTTLMHPSAAYNTGRMIAQLVFKDFAIGKSYTCGHKGFMTHDEYIGLFARVLGVEPNIIHIPTDLVYSVGGEEANSSLLNELTRYNVAFSMENFKNDFPGFSWEMTLEECVREFIEYHDKNGLLPDPREEIFEDRLIAKWNDTVKRIEI